MNDRITIYGKILFEPENKTKKHEAQSSWKKMAMVLIDGDICELYSWFIQRRYNILLNKPLRGAHISFINDSIKDISHDGLKTIEEVQILWESVKTKWDGQIIPITIDVKPKSNSEHWWLNIPHDERVLLHEIRAELGLGKPYWGLHMSLGTVHPRHVEHSKYIVDGILNGLIPE